MSLSEQGLEQAAILLLGIGEENAAEILRHMEPAEVQRIGMVMSQIKDINRQQVQGAISSFVTDVEQQTSFGLGADSYVKNMLESALGKDKAGGLYNRIQLGIDTTGLEALSHMEAVKIADLIRKEHPQVKAMVLSYLEEEKSAEVLSSFPDNECVDLLMRVATLGPIQPEILQYLNEVMEQHLAKKKGNQNEAMLGGIKNVANILNFLDTSREEEILTGIQEEAKDLGKEIKELMFVFDHLLFCDDRSMQSLLRNVPSETLIVALRGADDAIKEKFFANMSKRAGELMKDDMDAMGPVRISDVEASQKEVISIAARMRESGELKLMRGGEETV